MNKLRYILYARKSSEAKERQALSIQDQIAEDIKTVERDNLSLALEPLQESRSAYKPKNRPVFDKMMALIESRQADAILTWKPDRLCRNPEEGGKILQMLQDGVIKEIRCADGSVYTQDSDHLILQIHFGMANQYSRNLSQNVKRGLNHKCERGEYPRPAPVGFEGFGDRGRRNIRPHPFEAPIIRELFELASTGKHSLGYLIEYARKRGLKTKNGKGLGKAHMHVILTSSTYYGQFTQNGELYQGNYEPIISKKLYDAVQKALKLRSKPKVTSWDSDWNGLAFCGDCGCAITTTNKTKHYRGTDRTATYSYVHCTHRRGNCDQPPIPATELGNQLLDYIAPITIDEETWTLGMKLLKSKYKNEADKTSNFIKHHEAEHHTLQEKLNGLIDMRANGELTREEFMIQKQEVLLEQAKLDSLINDGKQTARTWLELTEEYLNNAFQAREIMESGIPAEKRDLIMAVGQNLILKDKRLDFSLKQPYDVLLLPKYRTNMLGD